MVLQNRDSRNSIMLFLDDPVHTYFISSPDLNPSTGRFIMYSGI